MTATTKGSLAVKNGVDLLRNSVDVEELGPFDGRVGAHIQLGHTPCFITTNADYIPELLPTASDHLQLRRDMRYGPDDPTVWPQQYSVEFCHLGAIPRPPSAEADFQIQAIMWWDPHPEDFVSTDSGLTVTRGLGKLTHTRSSRFVKPVETLLKECAEYQKGIVSPAKISPIITGLAQSMKLALERLRMLPSTYPRMLIEVTTLQRCYLELWGALRYMSVYKPRMDSLDAPSLPAGKGLPDECVGVFTSDPAIAQQFHKARIPYWLIRPLTAFHLENIVSVVKPVQASSAIVLVPAEGFAPVPVGPKLEDRLRSLHLCTRSTPWYTNPFATVPAVPSPVQPIAGPSQPRIQPSSSSSPAPARAPSPPRQHAPSNHSRSPAKPPKGPPKEERNKFEVFDSPYMPTVIPSWAISLAQIDRSHPPTSGADQRNVYVYPEPAILVSAADDGRRRMMLHHYQLIRDALIYRFGDPNISVLTAQQWRDILQGKIQRQGKAGSRAEARTAVIETVLAPAMRACGLEELTGFPVDPQNAPPTEVNRARELVWEAAEYGFRYELLALDERASGIQRPDECRQCFPGQALVGFNITQSKEGFAAADSHERRVYLLRLAKLMLDWKTPDRSPLLTPALQQPESTVETRALEDAVTRYYTKSFYDLFGRAAIVPMRIDHELGQ
ncbi:hypothetical protein R3P38DRAFT_3322376 [Favolaschia claudopus]|uniref:Uncharacterized protein n=1 Tax=Favolaschia claudopus TaxID=2862362 RepID=A0AAW0AKH7_9AGAR